LKPQSPGVDVINSLTAVATVDYTS